MYIHIYIYIYNVYTYICMYIHMQAPFGKGTLYTCRLLLLQMRPTSIELCSLCNKSPYDSSYIAVSSNTELCSTANVC